MLKYTKITIKLWYDTYTYSCVSGAITKVPIPEPQTAIPVANARFFSKYIETLTIAGKYIRPKPMPKNRIKI